MREDVVVLIYEGVSKCNNIRSCSSRNQQDECRKRALGDCRCEGEQASFASDSMSGMVS